MANLRIGYLNYADLATLTGNPVFSSANPVTYLQNDFRGYPSIAAASGSQEIKGTWGGTAYPVSCVRLERTNLVDGDTWRIQLYSDDAWTTQIYDSVAAAPFATDLFDTWSYSNADKFFTSQPTCKSFKITVVAASAFSCVRLYVGAYTEVSYNPKYGMRAGWATSSAQTRRDGGSLSVNVKAKWRQLAFDMMLGTEAERAAWDEIGQYSGIDETVWLSVFPEAGGTQERDHSTLGKFEQTPQAVWAEGNTYDLTLTFNGL